MARIKLTEYRAKRLILENGYRGISIRLPAQAGSGENTRLPAKGRFAVKVDQGVKKRMKQGLVVLDQSPATLRRHMRAWHKKGFTRFLIEPMVPHESEDERYLSLERVREGLRLMYARQGGIDIEAHPEEVEHFIVSTSRDVSVFCKKTKLPESFMRHLIEVFEKHFFAFLEINPLVLKDGKARLLDAAALVDSAGEFFVKGAWSEADVVKARYKHKAESRVEALATTTPASLKLTVVNKNGSLFFLLSGGGGSIVIADEAEAEGFGGEIGNYGEYSGGPTREETYLYAREVIGLMLSSSAKKKALVIAGGIANFTDIRQTFAGVIDALAEVTVKLRAENAKVFVRRGGPNEKEGLAHMREFLKHEKLLGSVHDSSAVITAAVDDAIRFIKRATRT